MKKVAILLTGFLVLTLAAAAFSATAVSMKVTGPGVVNDTTLKAGEKVSFDIYTTTDTLRTGFTLGFTIKSSDIKKVVHVSDSGKGLNANGDIKGYNGWQDKSIWDLQGVFAVERDWDGQLPDLIGFGGVAVKIGYRKEVEPSKKLSFELVVPETGTLVVDSAFFPPGGEWIFSAPEEIELLHVPAWDGPHKFKIVK
ncbi:MAG: hypothetical protein OEW00_09660 [candidate division Zixibacteria bacterium]|nr:hypothetical protein [candidate division Zixibacteria bacterium]